MTWDELEAAGPYQDDHHQMVYLEQNNEPMAFGVGPDRRNVEVERLMKTSCYRWSAQASSIWNDNHWTLKEN